jgi:hypothetical protein
MRAGVELDSHQRLARTRRVPRRVEQVDHGQRRVDPRRQLVGGRHRVADARRGDLLLRARQPCRHRRLRDEERVRDVRRRDAAYEPQRERDLRFERERRMAAREDQPQPVVGDRVGVGRAGRVGARRLDQQRQLGLQRPPAAHEVERAPPRDRRQPGAGPLRHTVACPGLQRLDIRVLHRLLRGVEVARVTRTVAAST